MDSIVATEAGISYLGVRLEKAQDASGDLVPRKATFTDYVNDPFSIDLQKRLAVAFSLGQPILIEGGTGIGKTTAVQKMAADLGWEVHSLQCHSHTEPEHLMGRYVPNTRTAAPPYHFADGPITRGLRQEDGKTKVILLEDLNVTMKQGHLVRAVLEEVLDALERNDTVVVPRRVHEILKPRYGNRIFPTEERISVSRRKTKVVALVCPPGLPYLGREPLNPRFMDRWNYQKMPSELPDAIRMRRMLGLFDPE